jgi:hypothetical protein
LNRKSEGRKNGGRFFKILSPLTFFPSLLPVEKSERWLLPWCAALGVCAAVAYAGTSPYDDGYFYLRFARNFVEHGVFARNVADGPVHGITSQLFQLVTTVLRWCMPTHALALAKLFSTACLVGAAGVLHDRARLLTSRPFAATAIATAAMISPLVLLTIHTGMETALALLLVAISTAVSLDD